MNSQQSQDSQQNQDSPDAQAVLAAAAEHFGLLLAQVRVEQSGAPTPCDPWTVRDLIEHVIGGNQWAARLLAGASAAEAMAQVKATAFSGDLIADYTAGVQAQQAAFSADGALDRTVAHFIGPVPARQFLGMRIGDVLIHSWDLARAAELDEQLPAGLVQAGLAIYEARAGQLAGTGMFGAGAQGAPPPRTEQERLLQLTGRRP